MSVAGHTVQHTPDNSVTLTTKVLTMNEPNRQLVKQLKMYQAGANVHTVNKARYYYTGARTQKTRDMLDPMIRVALVTHDWAPLRTHMQNWW